MRNPVNAEMVAAENLFHRETYEAVPESETFAPEFERGAVRSIHEQAVAYPAPDTAFIQSIPTDTPTISIKITSEWDTGFQAAIIVDNPESDSIPAWTLQLDPGETTLTSGWGKGARQAEGDHWLIRPGNGASTLSPGETTVYEFVASGDASSLGLATGTFRRAGYPTPGLKIERAPHGQGVHLAWDHVAPMYQVEMSTDLSPDGWQPIDTLYGHNDWSAPATRGSVFYRIKPIY